MSKNQIYFILINIVGGLLVLGSYYLGLNGGKKANALWGGTPASIRPMYTVSMLVSAVGYFIFSAYIFKNLDSQSFSTTSFFKVNAFLLLFVIFLGASTFWMPLTNVMVSNPSTFVWISIRVVLAVVALASLGVFILLLRLDPKPSGAFYIASLISIFLFTFHTGVLDAILWPYFWGM